MEFLSNIVNSLLLPKDDDTRSHDPLLPMTRDNPPPPYEYESDGTTDDDDDDDDVLLPPETEPLWNTQEEFARYVYGLICDNDEEKLPSHADYYFDMFSTEECDPYVGEEKVTVYWLPKRHPYAIMIREANINYFREHRENLYPIFSQHMSCVVYHKEYIDQAVDKCKEWHAVLYKKPEEEEKEKEKQEEE